MLSLDKVLLVCANIDSSRWMFDSGGLSKSNMH